MRWPIGLDVPLLAFHQTVSFDTSPLEGLQLTDRDPTNANDPPVLYLSVYFKRSRYFGSPTSRDNEKWLLLEANMRFALNLRIQVSAWNDRDVSELMCLLTNNDKKYLPDFLRDADSERVALVRQGRSAWDLHGSVPEGESSGMGDYFYFQRKNNENRLIMSTFTPSYAGISIHARISDEAVRALADYLEASGFAEPFYKPEGPREEEASDQ